jgi:hypothetical protein
MTPNGIGFYDKSFQIKIIRIEDFYLEIHPIALIYTIKKNIKL